MYTFEIVPVWVLWDTDYDGRHQHMLSIHDHKVSTGMCQATEQRKALKTTYEGRGGTTISYYLLDNRVQSFEMNEPIDSAEQRQVATARAKLSSEDFTALVKAIREGKVK